MVEVVMGIVAQLAGTFASDVVDAECCYLFACQVDCTLSCSSAMLVVKEIVELFGCFDEPHGGVPFPKEVEVSFDEV